MRIYLAAPWAEREQARAIAAQITAAGIEVNSRWLTHPDQPMDATEELRVQALQDLEDVDAADWVMVVNLQKSEGKAVETGYALALGIPVISVGGRSNVFQTLCLETETVEQAIEILLEHA